MKTQFLSNNNNDPHILANSEYLTFFQKNKLFENKEQNQYLLNLQDVLVKHNIKYQLTHKYNSSLVNQLLEFPNIKFALQSKLISEELATFSGIKKFQKKYYLQNNILNRFSNSFADTSDFFPFSEATFLNNYGKFFETSADSSFKKNEINVWSLLKRVLQAPLRPDKITDFFPNFLFLFREWLNVIFMTSYKYSGNLVIPFHKNPFYHYLRSLEDENVVFRNYLKLRSRRHFFLKTLEKNKGLLQGDLRFHWFYKWHNKSSISSKIAPFFFEDYFNFFGRKKTKINREVFSKLLGTSLIKRTPVLGRSLYGSLINEKYNFLYSLENNLLNLDYSDAFFNDSNFQMNKKSLVNKRLHRIKFLINNLPIGPYVISHESPFKSKFLSK